MSNTDKMEENILRKQNKVNDENNCLMLKRNIQNYIVESWPIIELRRLR